MMNEELAQELIEHATQLLEQAHQSTGRNNLAAARAAGDAALLLGFGDNAERCEYFLRTAAPQSFWDGTISNFPIDRDSVSERARSLSNLPQLEKDHPPFTPDYPCQVLVEGMGEHIAACRTRDYETAFNLAGSNEYRWHEVILSQALNGDLSLVMDKLPDVKAAVLRHHVCLVLAIEAYRRDGETIGSKMVQALQRSGIDEYTAVNLALGIMNRVPWICYPFADF